MASPGMHAAGIDANTAVLLCDMQNDFLHRDGAYARGGAVLPDAAAIIAVQRRLIDRVRAAGGWVVATHFTLVPGRDGEPMIAPHLKALRPFLARGDFQAGSWGHQVLEELGPVDAAVEKIAFSAFYMTRLEWLLRKAGIRHLLCCGIVTNGGVASTVRDAHVRDFEVTVVADGCAAFSRRLHEEALAGLAPVATVAPLAALL